MTKYVLTDIDIFDTCKALYLLQTSDTVLDTRSAVHEAKNIVVLRKDVDKAPRNHCTHGTPIVRVRRRRRSHHHHTFDEAKGFPGGQAL